MSSTITKINNFNLLRLVVAFQVVYGCMLHQLKIDNKILVRLCDSFFYIFQVYLFIIILSILK